MADSFDCSASSLLLCAENSNTCFDDLDFADANATNECTPYWQHHQKHQNPNFNNSRSESFDGLLPLLNEEGFRALFEREIEHLPRDDYLNRLRSGDLELGFRKEALDWIWKAHSHYSFGPLCICLAMNYLDRFLSVYELPRGKSWTMQLLAVACLSIAAKMEEAKVPQSVDLQVGDPKFMFEAKTIQRMELLVLSILNWRMQAITPCSFIDYFLRKINTDDDRHPSLRKSVSSSIHLILSTIKGIDFLEFRPSEIAASVAISVSEEIHEGLVDIDNAISSFKHVEKGRVMKCLELIRDLSLMMTNGGESVNVVAAAEAVPVPQSPVGVLDAAAAAAACSSYNNKSGDDLTVGSCANSSHTSSPNSNKRRKLDNRPASSDKVEEVEEDFKS